MNSNMLGIYVASVTPFTQEDKIDGVALELLMERNIREGASGFFIGGSSAECFLLSHKERVETFEIASQFKDKTKLIAHIGSLSTKEAIEFGKDAKAMGYHSVSATPPFYYGFGSKEICKYYYEISAALDMPIIVYNFPGNTNKDFDLTNPDYKTLFVSDAVEGVKHTNQVVFQMERFIQLNPKLKIFNGFDETMVAGLALGAKGSIGSTFNCMLPHYLKIYHAFLNGEIEVARELQHKANTIMAAFCKVGLIPALKYVLATQGNDVGAPRSPFVPLEKEAGVFLDGVLEENLVV